jgi:hypothetical protein
MAKAELFGRATRHVPCRHCSGDRLVLRAILLAIKSLKTHSHCGYNPINGRAGGSPATRSGQAARKPTTVAARTYPAR